MGKFIKFIGRHKGMFTVGVAVLGVGSYFGYQYFLNQTATSEVTYVTSEVTRGNIVSAVSGTGLVSVSNQVELKPDASGKIVYLNIKAGQEVKKGDLLAQLDATDAVQSVRDAKDNLESAKLALEKLTAPIDELDIVKAKNSLAKAEEALPNAQDDLAKAYEDGYNDVANVFLDLPNIMSGLENILFGYEFKDGQWNIDYYKTVGKLYDEGIEAYADAARLSYDAARESYEKNFDDYKAASRLSDQETVAGLIDETYATLKSASEAIKKTKNFLDFYEDTLTKKNVEVSSKTQAHQTSLENYTGTTNGHLSQMSSDQNSIDAAQEDIINAQRTIQEQQGALDDLLAGVDPLDVRSQELTIKQRESSLQSAQQKLADYYVRAPFDGVIAEATAQLGESASSGTSIATLITKQKIAEVTLNEIDAAKVKVGQRATLTFDAVSDLSITGEVVEIDTLGEVSQGVVSYGIKIGFDVQDDRVKPGMSASVSIIIESRQNVLTVPSGAVKNSTGSSYVEVLVDGVPQQKTIILGISDDTAVEVTDGLVEGDRVITSQKTGSSSQSSQSNSTNSGPGGNDAMRGMMQLTR
ncbi:MAG: efflux RND transporter periplasmic adaptor subunit [Candidatus Buchananbacteria bacterium]|nr:efflux RND transporter periplasmic adaptor subunit [Candidatus Buchananbacteria bacterium]